MLNVRFQVSQKTFLGVLFSLLLENLVPASGKIRVIKIIYSSFCSLRSSAVVLTVFLLLMDVFFSICITFLFCRRCNSMIITHFSLHLFSIFFFGHLIRAELSFCNADLQQLLPVLLTRMEIPQHHLENMTMI